MPGKVVTHRCGRISAGEGSVMLGSLVSPAESGLAIASFLILHTSLVNSCIGSSTVDLTEVLQVP